MHIGKESKSVKLSMLIIMTLGMAHIAISEPDLNVVPAVQEWKASEGSLNIQNSNIHLDSQYANELEKTAEIMNEELTALSLGKHEIQTTDQAPDGSIFLTLSKNLDVKNDEGYTIDIGKSVIITAKDSRGVFNASRTLMQILIQNKENCSIPKGNIKDWPDYKHRMLMIDVGRKPFPIEVLKDYIRILGWYRMNELHLHLSDEAFGGKYTGFRIQCDTYPGLASKDLHYTKKELQDLQDFARARNVTITPEIDMPGHSRVFTDYWPDICLKDYPNYMDVTNPETINRMKKVLDEVIPIFNAPDFHIGTDEYRVGGPDKEKLHETFRQFINIMNAHVRSHGKNTRIWSGFEHMMGSTEIDPTITIDMWETDDAKGQIAKGHKVINSNHGRTYIVPGCHYYGVNNPGIYNSWEPWMVSGDMQKNPPKDNPALLGGKLHIWNDQGPTGYNMNEIARLALPSIHAFAEKLWGVKGSADYASFAERTSKTLSIPCVTVLDRALVKDNKTLILDMANEQELSSTNTFINLPLTDKDIHELEYPWTLTMDIMKTQDNDTRGVIISSDLAEICSDYRRTIKKKIKDADGKQKEEHVPMRGLGVIRAAGSPAADAADSHLAKDVSAVYSDHLPIGKWQSVTVVGQAGKTTVYINGQQTGMSNNQTLCPLARIGSRTGNSFIGKIRNIKVYSRVISRKEIARSAGIVIPENIIEKAKVSASRSDTEHGFIPEYITDDDPSTRWSSGPGNTPTAVLINLQEQKSIGCLKIKWEVAYASEYRISASIDGETWKEVWKGKGQEGEVISRFNPVNANHIKIDCLNAGTDWGYSIWEAEAYDK